MGHHSERKSILVVVKAAAIEAHLEDQEQKDKPHQTGAAGQTSQGHQDHQTDYKKRSVGEPDWDYARMAALLIKAL